MLSLPQITWDQVAARIARADGPIAWAWVALPIEQQWRVVVLTVRGATVAENRFERFPRMLISTEQLTPQAAAPPLWG